MSLLRFLTMFCLCFATNVLLNDGSYQAQSFRQHLLCRWKNAINVRWVKITAMNNTFDELFAVLSDHVFRCALVTNELLLWYVKPSTTAPSYGRSDSWIFQATLSSRHRYWATGASWKQLRVATYKCTKEIRLRRIGQCHVLPAWDACTSCLTVRPLVQYC